MKTNKQSPTSLMEWDSTQESMLLEAQTARKRLKGRRLMINRQEHAALDWSVGDKSSRVNLSRLIKTNLKTNSNKRQMLFGMTRKMLRDVSKPSKS